MGTTFCDVTQNSAKPTRIINMTVFWGIAPLQSGIKWPIFQRCIPPPSSGRWRQQASLKRRLTSTRLHGAVSLWDLHIRRRTTNLVKFHNDCTLTWTYVRSPATSLPIYTYSVLKCIQTSNFTRQQHEILLASLHTTAANIIGRTNPKRNVNHPASQWVQNIISKLLELHPTRIKRKREI
jgi:hypothetical protein